MKRDLKGLRNKLRADARCARLLTLFQELPLYRIPLDDYLKEIEQIHKTRNIRFLSQASPRFIEAVVDASIKDQSNRSRLAEISIACYKAENTLNEALDPLRHYLLVTYAADISFVRTKDERLRLIDMALQPFLKFIAKATQVREVANMVITDIDKGAWSLVRLIDAMKLKAGKGEQSI